MSITEIVAEIERLTKEMKSFQPEIILTGGEPFLQNELPELVLKLKKMGFFISVETNATIYTETKIDFYTLSPKLKNSSPKSKNWIELHNEKRINYAVICKFITNTIKNKEINYQIKFQIKTLKDELEILKVLNNIEQRINQPVPPEKVVLIPEGVTKEEIHSKYLDVLQMCLKHGFRLSPRLHIDIWGNKRGV